VGSVSEISTSLTLKTSSLCSLQVALFFLSFLGIVDFLQSIVSSEERYRLTDLNSRTAYGQLAVTFKLELFTNKKYTENIQSCIESIQIK
jgi:hypothetical protein